MVTDDEIECLITKVTELARKGQNIDRGEGRAIRGDIPHFKGMPEHNIRFIFSRARERIAAAPADRGATETPKTPTELSPPPSGLAESLEAKLLDTVAKLDRDAKALQLDPEAIDAHEFWIKARITDKVLGALNTMLTKEGRRKLNYQDLAVIALIHRRSIEENKGYSMHSRFVKFSQCDNEFLKPLHSGHVARVLVLLEAIGYHRLVAKHDKAKHLPGRYEMTQNGMALS